MSRALQQMTVAFACGDREGEINAIREHTLRLAEAVADQRVEVEVFLRGSDGKWSDTARETRVGRSLAGVAADHSVLVLQYQPFLYGRWGFSPWLPASLLRSRRRRPRPTIALIVHERPVQPVNVRWALMGLWQRFELRWLQLHADVVFITIEAWRESLARRFAGSALHLPVGSNLPDRRADREAERERIGVGRDTVVLTLFGTAQPVRRLDIAVSAANAVATSGRDVLLLNLGAGAPALSGVDSRIDVRTSGELPADALARQLAATDVFLAPFIDGVSTRRTTVMAALQHGLAVVGTDAFLTDSLLREATDAIRLLPLDRPELFVEEVVKLSKSSETRIALGREAAALYSTEFGWPVTARRLIRALDLESGHGN